MRRRVVAIGLDSADPEQLLPLIDAGNLPNLGKMLETGAFARLRNEVSFGEETAPYSSTEGSWVAFQTAVRPERTGYWETFRYDPQKYVATSDQKKGGYDYQEFPPFYALGDGYRVGTFDLPVSALVPDVNGVQVLGWGGHWPFVTPGSQPNELLGQINQQFGKNRVLYRDYGEFWSRRYLRWIEQASIRSIEQRTRVCRNLLSRDRWDLFLAAYGETHGAGHDLWFASDRNHPVHHAWNNDYDPLERVWCSIDRSVGDLRSQLDDDTDLFVYSVHGLSANVTDLGSFFFLPEALYRLEFPGRCAFAPGRAGTPPPPPIIKGKHNHWFGEIWRRKFVNRRELAAMLQKWLPAWLIPRESKDDVLYPYTLDWFGPETGWLPAVWFQPIWPRMRAFALPSFSDGHIRINLRGRERKGIVAPENYHAECQRIRDFLLTLTNPRTGRPIVNKVVQPRPANGPVTRRSPDADLIVIWDEQPFDVVEGAGIGRIGPVPYHRTGGHRGHGFLLAAGAGVPAVSDHPTGEAIDLGPTFLQHIGAQLDPRFDGKPLFDFHSAARRAA